MESRFFNLPQQAPNLLERTLGMSELRDFQLHAFSELAQGKDCLIVAPTGSGKSLCYILPALSLHDEVAIVISPLIALMRDQVAWLHAKGIAAGCLDSQQSMAEQASTLELAYAGKLKLLFLAPERLVSPNFQQHLAGLPIGLVAIDEAHCVSQWGWNFRPDYRRIGPYLPEGVQKLALTATATQSVVDDLTALLHLRQPIARVVAPVGRQNIESAIEMLQSRGEMTARVAELLRQVDGPAIVYATTRAAVESLANMLNDQAGERIVGAYHAGMSGDSRQRVQSRFMRDSLKVVVATSAFGQGVHKPNVRLVVQAGMPGSMEQYVQAAGRAGRDGKPARSIMLWLSQDWHIQKFMLDKVLPPDLDQTVRRLGQCADFIHFEDLATALGGKPKDLEGRRQLLERDGILVAESLGWRIERSAAAEFLRGFACRRRSALERLATVREFCNLSPLARETFADEYFALRGVPTEYSRPGLALTGSVEIA